MKKQTKKIEERLLQNLIAVLKKSGTRCGTGDQINAIRAQQK